AGAGGGGGKGGGPGAVTRVPATPTQTMAVAAVRNRRQPMCIPPSNKMIASATLTTCSTVLTGSTAFGHSSAAIDAQTRKNAGAGTRSRELSRLDSTATVPTRPITSTIMPNCSVPVISADGKPSHLPVRGQPPATPLPRRDLNKALPGPTRQEGGQDG